MSTVLGFLEILGNNVIYIPGNHDAKTTMVLGTKPRLSTYSKNVHRDVFRIGEDLVLMGLGGSLPGYRDGQQEWVGYPYQTDEALEADLTATHELAVKENILKETDNIILMTHVGPHCSSTAIDSSDLDESPIISGSKAIENFIVKNNKQVFLNIHGHTHASSGMVKIGSSSVVNAGPLKFGCYAVLVVEKHFSHGWRVASIDFRRL
eukprot:gene15583-18508_t